MTHNSLISIKGKLLIGPKTKQIKRLKGISGCRNQQLNELF